MKGKQATFDNQVLDLLAKLNVACENTEELYLYVIELEERVKKMEGSYDK